LPTYLRNESVHGLGVIGGQALRESEGTDVFDTRQEVTFMGSRGDSRLIVTGVSYDFDWPGTKRSLDRVIFGDYDDYWAYENIDDNIDKLEIIVESRSDQLLLSPSNDCAILYRANKAIEKSTCRAGEQAGGNQGPSRLPSYGGALIAEFADLKPGDEAILKYEMRWR
jgi:hypothetical protein